MKEITRKIIITGLGVGGLVGGAKMWGVIDQRPEVAETRAQMEVCAPMLGDVAVEGALPAECQYFGSRFDRISFVLGDIPADVNPDQEDLQQRVVYYLPAREDFVQKIEDWANGEENNRQLTMFMVGGIVGAAAAMAGDIYTNKRMLQM